MMLAWAGAAALAAVGEGPAPAGLGEAVAPRRVAVVVGIDDYPADPTLGDLRFAGDDAHEMALLLGDEGYEVHSLVGRADTQRFEQLFAQATATMQRDDLLLVYFAGHAQLQPGLEESALQLLFSESRSADPWAGLSLAALEAAVDGVAARQRVVILDACYSRRTLELLRTETRGPVGAVALPEVSRFEAWIYAAAPEQAAQEDAALGHGVFTWYLLEALRGEGDLDGDGAVRVLEAFHHAGARTAQHTAYAQVPRIAEDRVGWQDLALTGTSRGVATSAVLPWLEREFPSLKVFVDGAPRGPGALPPGRHDVRVEDRGVVVRQGPVTLRPGDVVSPLAVGSPARVEGSTPREGEPPAARSASATRAVDGPEPPTLRLTGGLRASPAYNGVATVLGAEVAVLRGRRERGDMRGWGSVLGAGLGYYSHVSGGLMGLTTVGGGGGTGFALLGNVSAGLSDGGGFGSAQTEVGLYLSGDRKDKARWTLLTLGPQVVVGAAAGGAYSTPVGVVLAVRSGRHWGEER